MYAFIKAFIHGEAFVFPVYGVTQAAHLAHDGVARLFFPFPGFFNKFFAAHFFAAGLAFLG